jgi:hypothetical protein
MVAVVLNGILVACQSKAEQALAPLAFRRPFRHFA